MRSLPNSWHNTLTRLGLRRKKPKTSGINRLASRQLRMESLEERRVLAITFDFTPVGNLHDMLDGNQGVPAQNLAQDVVDGFEEGAALWQEEFLDTVTVEIEIDYRALDPGVLGEAFSQRDNYTYNQIVNSLDDDRSSSDDRSTTTNLQAGPSFDLLLNRTLNNPNGIGSATTYLDDDGDANNSQIRVTRANAKALGLIASADPALDGDISFSNLITWDFDRADGIDAMSYDFVGVAAHEIGHVLGFGSGVGVLDGNSPNENGDFFNDNQYTFVSPMDLFRFSTESLTHGLGVIDWTADDRDKFFSVDGGTTQQAALSEGVNHGDGFQASHWKDNLTLGIMDPTIALGELADITALDIQAFDVIGWDLIAPQVTTVAISGPNSLDGINGRYSIPTGSGDQIKTVPIGGADELEITFSEEIDLTTLTATGAFKVEEVSSGTPDDVTSDFSFNSLNGTTATWDYTGGSMIPTGQYEITLDDSILDLDGVALDGDWTNPTSITDTGTSTFPSGNGIAGGEFEFYFTILPGDLDTNNVVDIEDFNLLASNYNSSNTSFVTGDIDGDGDTDIDDYNLLASNYLQDFTNWLGPQQAASSGGGSSSMAGQLSARDAAYAAMAYSQFDEDEEESPLGNALAS